MAQLLMLAHRMPFPPNKGDKLRSFHLLRHLQQHHRVFLGCFVDDPADENHLPALRALCPQMHAVRLSRPRAALRSLGSLLRQEPLTLGWYRDAAMQAWVDDLVARERIDASVVFCSSMAPYAPAGRPMLLDFVDLDSAKWRQYGEVRRAPLAWIYRREARQLLRWERRLALQADASFFATPQELQDFEQAAPECRGRAQVLRNGVDTEHYCADAARPSPFGADEWPLVFTGSMNYWPNVDAVLWFAREVLPGLRARWPQLRLHVVGRDPSGSILALHGEAVQVSGTVPDVRPYLQHAWAVVAPMRYARGIQNKILEAMAMGQAVIASSACAKAVGAAAAQGLIAAGSADDYALALDSLQQMPPSARSALGAAARGFVTDHCRWERGLEPLNASLTRLGISGDLPC